MFGSRRLANPTSAIPLRNTTTGRGAQDDEAKQIRLLEIPDTLKVDAGMITVP